MARPASGPGARMVVTAAFVAALAGCGGDPTAADGPDPVSPAATTPEPTPVTDPVPTPDEAPETTGTTVPPSPSPTTRAGLREALLAGAAMPGLNDTFTWREGATSDDEPESFTTCGRFTMESIGATGVAVREFVPQLGGHAAAGQVVARFADTTSAVRAYDVLRAWHGRCAERIADHERHGVGDLRSVRAGDAAEWYLLTYGPVPGDPDAATFDATGFVRVGDGIAVVFMRSDGQDYNYPRGQEPVARAVRIAAERLG